MSDVENVRFGIRTTMKAGFVTGRMGAGGAGNSF